MKEICKCINKVFIYYSLFLSITMCTVYAYIYNNNIINDISSDIVWFKPLIIWWLFIFIDIICSIYFLKKEPIK